MQINEMFEHPQIKVELLRKNAKTAPRQVVLATLDPDHPIEHIQQVAKQVADKFIDGPIAGVKLLDGDNQTVVFTIIPADGFDILRFYISIPRSQKTLHGMIVNSVRTLAATVTRQVVAHG